MTRRSEMTNKVSQEEANHIITNVRIGFQITLTAIEKRIIGNAAKAQGKSITAFIREAALSRAGHA